MKIVGDHSGTDFRNENLSCVNFRWAEIDGADFTGANLRGANFTRMSIKHVNFTNAELAESNFCNSSLHNTKFDGACLFDAHFGAAQLRYASFRNANLKGSLLSSAVFLNTDFTGADFTGAYIPLTEFDDNELSKSLSIVKLAIDDQRGYTPLAVKDSRGEYKIYSGCRVFTVKEAIEHWGSKEYPSRVLGQNYVKGILALNSL